MNEMFTHIDLFSGIGGFALAAKWTGFETVVFCEKDEFCQKVLQKRFGGFIADSKSTGRSTRTSEGQPRGRNQVPIIPEIRDFDGTEWRGATLLTGGFPCQPFSVAGKRKGKEDDRYLWPEMLRVIKEAKPHWILAENVAGIFKMALDTVLADLEGEGYATGTVVIPAASVNAPHRRDRIWIIGYSDTIRCDRDSRKKREIQNQNPNMHRGDDNAPDSLVKGTGNKNRAINDERGRTSEGGREGIRQGNGKISSSRTSAANSDAPDSEGVLLQGFDEGQGQGEFGREGWEQNWLEVATRFCRVDDGVPNRVDRLKSLGNAIVPQVAAEIIRIIKITEEDKNDKR